MPTSIDSVSPPPSAHGGAGGRRFDLEAIAASLYALLGDFSAMEATLADRRDRFDDEVAGYMLAGYSMVDGLIADGVDLFGFGHLGCWLELNAVVLCGDDPGRRAETGDHLEATEERFWDDEDGGIRDVVEWHQRAAHQSVWKRAAGVYIRMVSEPQLFPEGNHRTGMLIMSYLLGREGKPPMVLTPGSAAAFFEASAAIKQMRKGSLGMMIHASGLKRQLSEHLKAWANPAFLISPT